MRIFTVKENHISSVLAKSNDIDRQTYILLLLHMKYLPGYLGRQQHLYNHQRICRFRPHCLKLYAIIAGLNISLS